MLCTDDQTFQIRQVQSSNSIFVLAPLEIPPEDFREVDVHSYDLTAVAQCPSTLELVAITPSGEAFLRAHLPIYGKALASEQLADRILPFSAISKGALLLDAPLSSTEYQTSWVDLCCFEDHGSSYVPSDDTLLDAWSSILSTATIRGINLGRSFEIGAFRNDAHEADLPFPLIVAVFARLREESTSSLAQCE